jgi:hypothetical protein
MGGPNVELRRVRALSARTHFVIGFGQVHFDPGSKKECNRFPMMPVSEIDLLVSRGWIADDVDADEPDVAPAAKASGVRKARSAPAAKASAEAVQSGGDESALAGQTADEDQAPA